MARWHCCNREFKSEEALARHDVEAHGVEREPVGTCCGLHFYTPEGWRSTCGPPTGGFP
jgi:hypothetical protein